MSDNDDSVSNAVAAREQARTKKKDTQAHRLQQQKQKKIFCFRSGVVQLEVQLRPS